jgi:hypothetical protein
MKRLFLILTLVATIWPFGQALAFNPDYILSDAELTDSQSMDLNQIQAFLSRGSLSDLRVEDHTGRMSTPAKIIWQAAQSHGISPKFLLVLLQKEQSLIEDPSPSQKQLDWAAGYAICDNCSMSDPTLQRWRGFGKQVNSAALQFSEGYMDDIELSGKTAGKYGPGLTITVDDTQVTPSNAATAAMYAYTPHLHGNLNFTAIWNRWFGREYPSGSLLQAVGEDGVWLIQYGYRRPITSASALHSRFNMNLVIPVSITDLEQFPIGKAISLPNYSLVMEDDGKISLLVDDTLRHITDMETFRHLGFSVDELVKINAKDASIYSVGEPITEKTSYPQGQLIQLSNTGAIFYIEDGVRHPVFDASILKARFANASARLAEPVEVEQYKEGRPLSLPDGLLVRSPEDPAVYVIADGNRLPILSESIFLDYGYSWSNVIVVPENVIKLHPLGDPLASTVE